MSDNQNQISCLDGDLYPTLCDGKQSHQCYYPDVPNQCCQTCADFYTGIQGCQYGDRISTCQKTLNGSTGHLCYGNTFRNDCCMSCADLDTNIQGCQYGDRIPTCQESLNGSGHLCYGNNFRNDCCMSCAEWDTNYQGCQYGDKHPNCQEDLCSSMGSKYRDDCCITCYNAKLTTYRPTYTSTPEWNPSSTTESDTPLPITNATNTTVASSSKMPDWMVPVIASAGGVIVLLIIVIVICVCVRRKRRYLDHLSPIDERMYNDYKMSKRPPVAPPRHLDMDRKPDWQRKASTASAEYAYINPNDVSDEVSPRRGDDPLPAPPAGVYLEFTSENNTEFVDTVDDGKLVNGKEDLINTKHASPKRSNTYQPFPGGDN